MNAEQIAEYIRRERFRAVVTEEMVMEAVEAVACLPQTFTCRDVVEAIPRDSKGCTVSEYLVTLWIENLVRRGQIRWTGAQYPRTYEAVA